MAIQILNNFENELLIAKDGKVFSSVENAYDLYK